MGGRMDDVPLLEPGGEATHTRSMREESRTRLGPIWLLLFVALAVTWVLTILLRVLVEPDAPFAGPGWVSSSAQVVAILATVTVVIVTLARKRWAAAVIVSVAGAAACIGAFTLTGFQTIDNLSELLQAESNVHDEFVLLSQAFENDGGAPFPHALRPLSRDDLVRVIGAEPVLYISAWENWRGEAGGGFLYTHDPTVSVSVASGYRVRPSVDLGDGWWYAEGS